MPLLDGDSGFVTREDVDVLEAPVAGALVTQAAVDSLQAHPDAIGRITREDLDTLEAPTATGLITQWAVDTLEQPLAIGRITQEAVDTLESPVATSRVTRVQVDVLRLSGFGGVTQEAVDCLVRPVAAARVTAECIDVLRTHGGPIALAANLGTKTAMDAGMAVARKLVANLTTKTNLRRHGKAPPILSKSPAAPAGGFEE